MTDETLLRWTVLAGLLLLLPPMVYFRVRSQTAGKERLDRSQEGWFMLLTLRPLALVAAFAMFGWLAAPQAMRWSQAPLPVSWRWWGIAPAVLGAALILWAFYHLGANLTDTVVTRSSATLVRSGPYRLVRHPYYDGYLLVLLGNSLLSASWLLLASGLLVFVLLVVRTRREEERLVARFGDEYRDYMATTGRFLPRLG